MGRLSNEFIYSCSDLNLEFEIPFRELGFFGVPHRSTCFVMPTVNCLVELTEIPFTVITLSGALSVSVSVNHYAQHCQSIFVGGADFTFFFHDLLNAEVNLVNLERVGFNLRNFDMVFIWKDLNRDVGRIDTIPSQSLETIKVNSQLNG
jgi:nucleosome binding factor SPN SPT16 subunit